jgi:ferrous iron transport protein A
MKVFTTAKHSGIAGIGIRSTGYCFDNLEGESNQGKVRHNKYRERKRRLMLESRPIALTRMNSGQSGIVIQVQGGRNVLSRLDALGIRPGKRITKISSMLMRGPVTIEVDRAQVAIGFGMASRVLVRPD